MVPEPEKKGLHNAILYIFIKVLDPEKITGRPDTRVQIDWASVTPSKFPMSFMVVPKDDLRERGWTFSTHLWNSSSYINNQSNQSFNTFPPMEKSGKKKSKSRLHSVVTETSFHQRRRR